MRAYVHVLPAQPCRPPTHLHSGSSVRRHLGDLPVVAGASSLQVDDGGQDGGLLHPLGLRAATDTETTFTPGYITCAAPVGILWCPETLYRTRRGAAAPLGAVIPVCVV